MDIMKWRLANIIVYDNDNICRVITHNDIRITLKYDISKEKLSASMDCHNWFGPPTQVALLFHFKCLNESVPTEVKIELISMLTTGVCL